MSKENLNYDAELGCALVKELASSLLKDEKVEELSFNEVLQRIFVNASPEEQSKAWQKVAQRAQVFILGRHFKRQYDSIIQFETEHFSKSE